MSMNVIAVMGKSKSGKNTVGQMIREIMGPGKVIELAFADKLKQMCMDLYDLSRDDVYTEEGKDRVTDFDCWKCPVCQSLDCFDETVDRVKRVVCRKCTAVGDVIGFQSKWTVRMILQHVGTEGCRKVDPYVWVNHAMRTAKRALENGVEITAANDSRSVGSRFTPSLVVITDCRFKSELAGTKKAGGVVWRIRRPETDKKAQGIAAHASENEMDSIPDSEFSRVFMNDGTLEDLRAKVKDALIEFNTNR